MAAPGDADGELHSYVPGLANRGNNCFANSTLQALAVVPPVRARLAAAAVEDGVVSRLRALLDALSETSAAALRYEEVPHGLIQGISGLGNGAQQDAHEFLQMTAEYVAAHCVGADLSAAGVDDDGEGGSSSASAARDAMLLGRAVVTGDAAMTASLLQHQRRLTQSSSPVVTGRQACALLRVRRLPCNRRWDAAVRRGTAVGAGFRSSELASSLLRSSATASGGGAGLGASVLTAATLLGGSTLLPLTKSTVTRLAAPAAAGSGSANPFSFTAVERIVCRSCAHAAAARGRARPPPRPWRGEPQTLLTLELPYGYGKPSLVSMLQGEFREGDPLDGYRCPGAEAAAAAAAGGGGGFTGQHDCRKARGLLTLPPALVVHLNRLSGGAKDGRHVAFPFVIDMAPSTALAVSAKGGSSGGASSGGIYGGLLGGRGMPPLRRGAATSPSSPQRAAAATPHAWYTLVAVVEHRGGSLGGHYVTYRRLRPPVRHVDSASPTSSPDFDAEEDVEAEAARAAWVCANDARVTPAAPMDVRSAHAYLLFYVRWGRGG